MHHCRRRCVQCDSVLLGDRYHLENYERLGVICSEECGSNLMLIEAKRGRDEYQGDQDIEDMFIAYIMQNDFEKVRLNYKGFAKLNKFIQYCRSLEMGKLLLELGATTVFEYVGEGRVAIEECAKYFSIRPFFREADPKLQETKELVADIGEHFARMVGEQRTTIHFDVSKYFPKWATLETKLFFVRALIWHGVFPDFSNDLETFENPRKLEDVIFRRYDAATFKFWYQQSLVNYIEGLTEATPWELYTLEGALSQNSSSPDSLKLLVLDWKRIYKDSRRAVTDMTIFRTAQSKVVKENPWERDKRHFFPAVRYAYSLETGMYYVNEQQKPEDPCGTFYYLEPDAKTFLYFENPLVVTNKMRADWLLSSTDPRKTEGFDTDPEYVNSRKLEKYANSSLFFTAEEYYEKKIYEDAVDAFDQGKIKYLGHQKIAKIDQPRPSVLPNNIQKDRAFYCGRVLGLYSVEDILDLDICRMARKKGYDGIILTRMVGSRRVVGEILDTRPREQSMQNLYFLEE